MSFYSSSENVALFGPDPKSVNRTNYACAAITVVAYITSLAVIFTRSEVDASHYFFAITMFIVAIPEFVLVYWYKQGDLPPKFKYLIGYITFSIILFSAATIVYFIVGVGSLERHCHNHNHNTTTTSPMLAESSS